MDKINWYSLRHHSRGQVTSREAFLEVGGYTADGADVRAYLMDDRDGHPLSVVTVHDVAGKASLVYEFTEV